jgi:hypothetical protein
MGALAVTAFLYEFSMAFPGAEQIWRFTGFERDLTYGGNVYTAAPFEFDSVQERVGLDTSPLTIKSRHFENNPLTTAALGRLEWPLKVRIIECNVSSDVATNLRPLFSGEVGATQSEGPFLNARAVGIGGFLDRKIPRQLLQPTCNWALFESLCGLLPADCKWSGQVAEYNAGAGELLVENVARVGGDPVTLVEHFFAGGYLIHGAGALAQCRMVGDSSAASGGSLTLVLGTPFAEAPEVGATVYFHPGCDGLADTCKNKFNNYSRFGGFPLMPIGNPSALKVSQNVSSGGKK